MSKIIFLDVDGVLNTNSDRMTGRSDVLKPKLLEQFGKIVAATKAKIVLSSSWRFHPQLCQVLSSALVQVAKVPEKDIIAMTGEARDGDVGRADEIGKWLDATMRSGRLPIASWVVLDDLPLGGIPFLASHFVRVDPRVGLTRKNAVKAIKILNNTVKMIGNSVKGEDRRGVGVEKDVARLVQQYQDHRLQVSREQIFVKLKELEAKKANLINHVQNKGGEKSYFDTGNGGALICLPPALQLLIMDKGIRSLQNKIQ